MNIEQSKKLSIIDFLDKENVTLKKMRRVGKRRMYSLRLW